MVRIALLKRVPAVAAATTTVYVGILFAVHRMNSNKTSIVEPDGQVRTNKFAFTVVE